MRFDLLPLLLSFLCACAIAQYVANDEHFCRAEFTLLFIFRFVFDSRECFSFLNVSSQFLYFVFHFKVVPGVSFALLQIWISGLLYPTIELK